MSSRARLSHSSASGLDDRLATRRSFAVSFSTVAVIAAYSVVTMIGLVIRITTFRQFTGHIDEPASLLAIQRVAETGVPMFPSGVLYLQGAVISYLAAPLAWVFAGESLFTASQMLNLGVASLLVPLSMKLVSYISGSIWPAIFAGSLVASDPSLIVWGVTLRPYGLLAVTVVAMLLLFTMMLKDGPEARVPRLGSVVRLIPISVAFGTFTHIGFWLMMPALAIASVMVWKGKLLTTHRTVLMSGLLSVIPLVAFLLLGRFAGTGAGTGEGGASNSFVGSHLVSPDALLDNVDLNWWIWIGNFHNGSMYELIPYLITMTSGVLVFTAISKTTDKRARWRSHAIGIVVLVHWSVIFAVTLLVATDPDPRYLHQVLALGYVIAALAIWCVWAQVGEFAVLDRVVLRFGIILLLVVPGLLYGLTGANWRMESPGGQPDYWQATAWAAENRDENQLVILALPTSAYFFFNEEEYDELMFLAGPENGQRAERYIKPNRFSDDGDYWLGLGSIGSISQLCTALIENADDAMIVVDQGRLSAPWALQGEMETAILGSTEQVFRGENGIMVLAVIPIDFWAPEAREVCLP